MNVNEITTLFNTIDANSDGKITYKEMKKSLKSLSEEQKGNISFLINANGKVNKSAFKMLSDGDKKINKNELLNYLTTKDEDDNIIELTQEEQESRNNILGILSNADRNKDGKITKGEIKKAYNRAVKNNDDKTVEYLENFMTTNSKGKKVVDKDTFKYIATSGVVKHHKSRGKRALKTRLGVYGKNISVTSRHYKKAATFYDFIKFDNDGDYNLSESETSTLNESKDFFYTIDRKKDGSISQKDIIKAYKNADVDSDTKQMLSSLVTVTANNKVKINKENFRTLSQGKKYLNSTDILAIKSNTCDATLTSDEVKAYLDKAKEFMSMDSNNNGKLTLKEIKKTAKNTKASAFATFLTSMESAKEMKKVFKQISNGKNYITVEDIKPYDKNKDGQLSEDEVKAILGEN